MLVKRRDFLQMGSLATASLMLPKFLNAFQGKTLVPPGNKVLIVVQLSGGNDGLNTIIPVTNDIYYKNRPKLAIEKDKALQLTDEAGIHNALSGIKELYDNGDVAIMNNVGYPNPDRSHFRSMDIWHSASESNQYISTGWLGRYLDEQCKDCDKPTQALEIDDMLSLALKGEHMNGLALKDPKKLYNTSSAKFFRAINAQHDHSEETVDYLYKTMSSTLSSADYIYEQSKVHPTGEIYPSTETGKNFKTIASLVLSDINTKVYYVSIGSFDTHVNQDDRQRKLFTELNDAITAFCKDMKKNNRFDDVLIMSFSEFGRRVAQNASGGTDHGTANNMFFIGGGLKQKGMLNAMPDLNDLADGDLKFNVDFKDVYATVLNKWLKANDVAILGKQHQYFNFI